MMICFSNAKPNRGKSYKCQSRPYWTASCVFIRFDVLVLRLEGLAAGGIAALGALAVAANADVTSGAFVTVLVIYTVCDLAVYTVNSFAIHNNTIPFYHLIIFIHGEKVFASLLCAQISKVFRKVRCFHVSLCNC